MRSQVFLSALGAASRIEHYETIRRRKDGSLLDISLTVSPIRDAQGNIVGASKIARDITRRKRVEVTLRESEQRLRLATQTGKLGVWDWDIVTNRISWSDSLYAIHGVRPDQFDGTVTGFAALVHPEDQGVSIKGDSARAGQRCALRAGVPCSPARRRGHLAFHQRRGSARRRAAGSDAWRHHGYQRAQAHGGSAAPK